MRRRGPIENERSYQQVRWRIAYKLIVLDHRRRPERYSFPPGGILALAEELRQGLWGRYYFDLVTAAKAVQAGFPLHVWRDELEYRQVHRAVHKQRPQWPRRR